MRAMSESGRQLRRRVIAASVACATAVSLGIAAPTAALADDGDNEEAGWYAVGPDGEVFDPNARGLWDEPAPDPEPGTVSPMLIDDPVTWLLAFRSTTKTSQSCRTSTTPPAVR